MSSVAVDTQQTEKCNTVPGLVLEQLDLCQRNPESLLCVSEGARQAIHECQNQFRFERWNCTTSQNYSVFGPIMTKGTRETAFIYSILSAGVTDSVTRACSAGNLTDCVCDPTNDGKNSVEGWVWGGCSDNVQYGLHFSRKFVDAPEVLKHQDTQSVRNKMNIHNNEVGRRTVRDMMRLRCRCHGVSGSCEIQTCWKSLPKFSTVGAKLKEKYEISVRIAGRSKRKLRPKTPKRHRQARTGRKKRLSKDDMVFVHKSPNFCTPNPIKGILGTEGRLCNRTGSGPESCDLLCCGRGYNTQVVRLTDRCQCRFIWCCYVDCKTCETLFDRHTCK
ncbi:WNT16 [Mytilus edulis]|uniref:Protein Wnt n=2 Tax=Mytilus TaxID=6548 RepID=A0A8S3TGG4_MYTED|nr:WNT16 [Mytilus edulis]